MFKLAPFGTKRLPIRHEEQHPVYSLQQEMNKLFEDFFRAPLWDDFGQHSPLANDQFVGQVMTRVDVSETDKELLVKVELPGMTEKEVEISISQDLLTISGEKKQEKEQTEKGWYRMERQYGSFSRSIPLPYEVESDKAEALYKNGVLSIKLPKSAAQQKTTKSIPVKPA